MNEKTMTIETLPPIKFDLTEAGLRGTMLDLASYDKETTWPDGFDPKAAGAILVE